MKYSQQIKPVSYLKAHTAEIIRELSNTHEPLIVTQNGEAKVVVQDIETFEQTRETIAILKVLALGSKQVEEGKIVKASDVTSSILGSIRK